MTCHRIAFITPTKDRPEDLRKMLLSLAVQSRRPDQVIVVDASAEAVESVCRSMEGLDVDYIRWTPKPSAAAQRNGGVTKLRKDIDLVCFFDDDQVLYPDALKKMMAFWSSADAGVGGASFYNTDNLKDTRSGLLKRSRLSNWLGLYASAPGRVAPSGWQSLIGRIDSTIWVDWIGSGASVWQRGVLDQYHFDEFFDGYSYLEDLDFSYSISRRYKLAVVANARFDHFHSPGGRTNPYEFGKVEVRNRLYFVRKHELSVPRCYTGLFIRWLTSLGAAAIQRSGDHLMRALGNIAGIMGRSRSGRLESQRGTI